MKNKKRAACLLLAVLCVVQLLTMFCVTAFAAGEMSSVSNVLDDLKRDPNFKVEDYPENPEDHSVQVIQVAEGANGELFLYVYRPEGTDNAAHRADSINMSLQDPTDKSQKPVNSRYFLTWLNSSGTLEKYKVNGLIVSSDAYRYYNIATIYRPFDEVVDGKEDSSPDDITNFKGFEVGKYFQCYYLNNTLVCRAATIDVVDIDIKTVGIVRYTDNFYLYGGEYCDSHFVTFSVKNYDVKKIFDAQVSYKAEHYYYYQQGIQVVDPIITDLGYDDVIISENDTASNDGSGFLGYQYTWKRILTRDQFLQQLEDFTHSEYKVVQGTETDFGDFVFQFLETDYESYNTDYGTKNERTNVTEVTVLRLHFLTESGVYDLGVVSDIVSDDGIPDFVVSALDNVENRIEDMWKAFTEWFEKIMSVILVILLVVILWPIVSPIFSILFNIISLSVKIICKVIWRVLTLPLKLCKWILFPKKE